MPILRPLLVLLAAAGIVSARQDSPKSDIARYIDWLSDTDPEIRAMASRKLVELGKDAVPALEKLLQARDALEIYSILRTIEVPTIASESQWVSPKDLPSEEELRKGLPEIDRSEAERYVHVKLADAFAQYKKGSFQRAYDMVGALILLEPGSRYADDLKKLRRACDTMITQTGLLRSKVLCAAPFGTVGDKLDLTLKMENVFPGPLRIGFGSGNGLQVRGYAIADIRIEGLDPLSGSVTMANRSVEVAFANPIDIAMGAQWEHVFSVETAGDFVGDTETLRRYTVSAWTQPSAIESTKGSAPRRLVFEPAVIHVIPAKYAHLVADPVASLAKSVEGGDSREVFISAMLAPSDRQSEVVELLIGAMEKANLIRARATISRMLTFLTDQKLGDDHKAWKTWWAGRPKPPSPRK